jgi:hypothetical protein
VFKSGDLVKVKRHKSGVDTIGPFVGEILWVDRDSAVAEVTDPWGDDWGIRLSKLVPLSEEE